MSLTGTGSRQQCVRNVQRPFRPQSQAYWPTAIMKHRNRIVLISSVWSAVIHLPHRGRARMPTSQQCSRQEENTASQPAAQQGGAKDRLMEHLTVQWALINLQPYTCYMPSAQESAATACWTPLASLCTGTGPTLSRTTCPLIHSPQDTA